MNEPTDLKVKQIMSKAVITCRAETTLEEVAQMMSDAEVSAIVVVKENGDMIGLISEFDLLKQYGQDLTAGLAMDNMVHDLIVIGPEEPVQSAASKMLEKRIHRLIVIDQGDADRAKGVISVSDIIRKMRRAEVPFQGEVMVDA